MTCQRRGFTLIELTLAIALSGVAVLLGAMLWREALTAGNVLQVHRARADRIAGGRRWLGSAIGSIEVGAAGDVPFKGHLTDASFTAWLPTTHGWPARQGLSLALSGQTLLLSSDDGNSTPIADGLTAVGFDYLLEPGLNSTWASAWESPVSAPLAIRIRLTSVDSTADTLLIVVGPRG